MLSRFGPRMRVVGAALAAVAVVATLIYTVWVPRSAPAAQAAASHKLPFCAVHSSLCTETTQPWNYQGQYTGHDEPSALFYSNVPGSGNSSVYDMTLPKDPPTAPSQDGSGGTWNFQLHPAFWFGMAMCDNQSAPDPGKACPADSDQNIYTSTNPHSAKYMGNTPGTAFMEMQFYPPNWAPVSCDPNTLQWCAALNIDSFSENSNTGVPNNSACLNAAGIEYVNYAIITNDGKSQAPADPLDQTAATFSTGPDTFEMNPGDNVVVVLHDTSAGFQVILHDVTTNTTGSMTASIANGFGHPLYQPNSSTCTDQPYAFHPMYSTSSPNTRVLWAAHSYNVAYSDEIGHFEYCNATPEFGNCTAAGVTDSSTGVDGDDSFCFSYPVNTTPSTITGCLGTDGDFDGPEYQNNWAGTNPNAATDASLHAQPVTFTSPLFIGPGHSGLQNYRQVAFETDLPRIEGADISPNNNCNRQTGSGCVNPPNGAIFYPIFAMGSQSDVCVWEEGGAYLPGARYPAGTTSTAEYGSLIKLAYPSVGGPVYLLEDFRNVLHNNPCPAPGGQGEHR